MAWSEKAIEKYAQLLRDNSPPWFGKRDKWENIAEPAREEWRKMACTALDAAAAVDGDAQWNAAIEAVLKTFFAEDMDDIPLFAQHAVCARDMRVAAAIRSLKRG